MFSDPTPLLPRRQPWVLLVSVAAHGFFLAWLLNMPRPEFIAPSSVAFGRDGSTVTDLYWPASDSKPEAAVQTHAPLSTLRTVKARIAWRPSNKPFEKLQPDHARSAEEATSAADASPNPGESVSAGTAYGSVGSNALSGDEIRPALPVRSSDPVVSSADLMGIVEGDVVIEITIDDRGNIIQKTVLKTLSPAVDAKVLAALENWRFRPATKNGVAIASKQDVYYHFRGSNG